MAVASANALFFVLEALEVGGKCSPRARRVFCANHWYFCAHEGKYHQICTSDPQEYIRGAAEIIGYILLYISHVFRWFIRCTTMLLRDHS